MAKNPFNPREPLPWEPGYNPALSLQNAPGTVPQNAQTIAPGVSNAAIQQKAPPSGPWKPPADPSGRPLTRVTQDIPYFGDSIPQTPPPVKPRLQTGAAVPVDELEQALKNFKFTALPQFSEPRKDRLSRVENVPKQAQGLMSSDTWTAAAILGLGALGALRGGAAPAAALLTGLGALGKAYQVQNELTERDRQLRVQEARASTEAAHTIGEEDAAVLNKERAAAEAALNRDNQRLALLNQRAKLREAAQRDAITKARIDASSRGGDAQELALKALKLHEEFKNLGFDLDPESKALVDELIKRGLQSASSGQKNDAQGQKNDTPGQKITTFPNYSAAMQAVREGRLSSGASIRIEGDPKTYKVK